VTAPSLRPAATPEVPLELLRSLLGLDAELAGDSAGGAAGDAAEAVWEAAALPVRGVTLDSRDVEPGDLYAALPGSHVHGARFADQAAARGAVAVLTDPAGAQLMADAGPPAAQLALLIHPDPRAVLGAAAAAVYGEPTRHMQVLAVTGTNGKTTVAFLLEAGLLAAGHSTGLVGTVITRIGTGPDAAVPSVRTTPEAPELQALFAAMRERGVDAAAMEVSSHALALHRVDGCSFAGAAFTNLSQDHLDFHQTIEEYFEAKALLFDPARGFLVPGRSRAVISADDPYGQRLVQRHPQAVTFGIGGRGDWQARAINAGPRGAEFTVTGPGGLTSPARVQLPGQFNVSNALCAIALLVETGTPLEAAVSGVAALPGVPGRMERVDAGQPFLAVVDYAHTPVAVAALLSGVRTLVPGRLIIVLGCGGDRDRGKRPLMGAAAVSGADIVILTSDNPRSEDPEEILAGMRVGADQALGSLGDARARTVVVEPDRAAAIALAVQAAGPGDAVLVAGKGHETGQEINGIVHPFDDRLVLRAALAGAPGAAGVLA
jgi:UDP-N-acetylmuramoyl-L-alanyl-D-glutamate--2,6-diaminopimelate ligase